MMLRTKYQGSRPCGFRQVDLFMFLPILVYVNHVILGAGHFWPKGHNLIRLVRGPPGDATYQISKQVLGLMVSDKKIFYVSPYISLCKACDPWGGAILTQGV